MKLAVLGTTYIDEEIVRHFLQALPPRFDQIATSIETLLDLTDVSLDELIYRLKPVEEKMNRNDKGSVTTLNLTEDELVARISSRLKMTGFENSESSKVGSSGCKRRRGRGRGHSRNNGSRGSADTGGRTGGSGGRDNGGGGITRDKCR
jgi:hypothetical protein